MEKGLLGEPTAVTDCFESDRFRSFASCGAVSQYGDVPSSGPLPDVGVLDLPPAGKDYVMMLGSNGVARWVTMESLECEEEETHHENDASPSRGPQPQLDSIGNEHERPVRLVGTPPPQPPQRATPPPSPMKVGRTTNDSSAGDARAYLWASKYAPRHFSDLLSDENINLEVLQWLKSWDSYVFARQSAATPPEPSVLLLVGPPGVGKSTLAQVCARHCNYEPVEVNASMDRTANAVEHVLFSVVCGAGSSGSKTQRSHDTLTLSSNRAESAPRENSRVTSSGAAACDLLLRPKCLIMDEVDGVATDIVELLRKLPAIRRPVICIANNLFAPNLRELRRTSLVKQLPSVNPQRLAWRLDIILKQEACQLDHSAVVELCHASNGDIRSCLNTLQFLCCQATTRSKMMNMLHSMKNRDTTMGLWMLWNELFQRKERAKYAQLLLAEFADGPMSAALPAGASSPPPNKPQRQKIDPGYAYLEQLLRHCSDLPALVDGAFQMYTAQQFADYNGCKTAACADAFSFQDALGAQSFAIQDFGIDDYGCYTCLRCFHHCASLSRFTMRQYPRELKLQRLRVQGFEAVIHQFIHGCHHCDTMPYLASAGVVACDWLPLLGRCLQPTFRLPPNCSLQLLPPRDMPAFAATVQRHIHYGLSYASAKIEMPDGREIERWVSDPEVLKEGYPASGASKAPNSRHNAAQNDWRKLLSAEIAKKVIEMRAARFASPHSVEKQSNVTAAEERSVPSTSIKADPAPVKKVHVKRDFFGRIISCEEASCRADQRKKEQVAEHDPQPGATNTTGAVSAVRFKYFDGATNAIRRPASLADFT